MACERYISSDEVLHLSFLIPPLPVLAAVGEHLPLQRTQPCTGLH